MSTSDAQDERWIQTHMLWLRRKQRLDLTIETVPHEHRDDPVLMGLRREDGTLTCGGCGWPIKAYESYLFMPGEGAHHLDDCLNPVCVLCGGTILGSKYLVRTPDPEWWESELDHVNHRECVEEYELIERIDWPEVCWPPDEEDE